MTSDTEQELWFMMIGAAIASKEARERIFQSLDYSDAPTTPLRNVLFCLQTDRYDKIHDAFESLGFKVSTKGSIFGQLVDRLRDYIFQTKVKKKMFLLSHSTGLETNHLKNSLRELLDDLEDSEDDSPEDD